MFGFSVKSYVRNTINFSCAKILLTSVILKIIFLYLYISIFVHFSYSVSISMPPALYKSLIRPAVKVGGTQLEVPHKTEQSV